MRSSRDAVEAKSVFREIESTDCNCYLPTRVPRRVPGAADLRDSALVERV